jgi:hypothetical protein
MFIWEVLFLLQKKFIFHFLSAKNGVFCEASAKNMLQKYNNHILNDIISYGIQNSPVVSIEKVL